MKIYYIEFYNRTTCGSLQYVCVEFVETDGSNGQSLDSKIIDQF